MSVYRIAKKTITYRAVASIYALGVAYVLTQNISLAITWSAIDTIGKMLLYGLFEWGWQHLSQKENI